MQQTIEKEFNVAMQWFHAIASARGLEKYDYIKNMEKQCPSAWALLLLYLNPSNVFHIRAKSLANDIKPDGEPYTSVKTN